MSLLYWADASRFWILRVPIWISIGGVVATSGFALVQRRQVRSSVDKRFLAVCAILLAFGYGVWPVCLGSFQSYKSGFGYSTPSFEMQISPWSPESGSTTTGFGSASAMTVLDPRRIPAGSGAGFWAGPLLGGITLVGTGFYIRRFWK